jgi:hypothetical protein
MPKFQRREEEVSEHSTPQTEQHVKIHETGSSTPGSDSEYARLDHIEQGEE